MQSIMKTLVEILLGLVSWVWWKLEAPARFNLVSRQALRAPLLCGTVRKLAGRPTRPHALLPGIAHTETHFQNQVHACILSG